VVFVSSNYLASHFEIYFNIISLSMPKSPNGLFVRIFESKYFIRTSLRSLEAVTLTVLEFIAFTEPNGPSARSQKITVALHHTLLETVQ
jgi:hypothetical protein